MEQYCGEQGGFPARMEETNHGGERLGEMVGEADDGADRRAAAWHNMPGDREHGIGERGSPRWWAFAFTFP